MAVKETANLEIKRFVDAACLNGAALHAIESIDDLNAVLKSIDSPLTGSLIPLEQAT